MMMINAGGGAGDDNDDGAGDDNRAICTRKNKTRLILEQPLTPVLR